MSFFELSRAKELLGKKKKKKNQCCLTASLPGLILSETLSGVVKL